MQYQTMTVFLSFQALLHENTAHLLIQSQHAVPSVNSTGPGLWIYLKYIQAGSADLAPASGTSLFVPDKPALKQNQ